MFRVALPIVWALLFGWALLPGYPARADVPGWRVALVVGVGAYQHAPILPNTRNDAQAVAAALTRIGFEVDTVIDPDRAMLEAAVRRFGKNATGADAALFYYAGHALEFDGRNWLVPVQAELHTERDLRFEALEIDAVLEQIEGQARVALLMLDSCRDNPFRQTLAIGTRGIDLGHGLAPQRAAVGTLIVYATAPGTEAADGSGPHSPFTTALLRHIGTPGLEIRSLISEVRKDVRQVTGGRQVPWDSSALEGEFFLIAAPQAAPPPPVDRPADRNAEVVFWESVKDTNDPADLRAYLSRYPDGLFAELARNRLARLPGQPQPPDTRSSPPADLASELRAALATIPEDERALQIRRYLAAKGGRALAIAPGHATSWLLENQPDDATAEARTLEACQLFANEPCMLVALGNHVLPKAASGAWPVQPQPRIAYRGDFDPAMVPTLLPKDRSSGPVPAYRGLGRPKAAAIHPWGRFFVGQAADQAAAETVALKSCNDDPDRKGVNGPCFLYAVGDQVVLPDRRMAASSSAVAATPATVGAGGIEHIAGVAGRIAPGLATVIRQEYAPLKGHKAIAVHLATAGSFWWDGADSAARAEQWALEGCQQQDNSPCILLAVDDTLRANDPASAPPRQMERLAYAGQFRADMLPMNFETKPDVLNYPGLSGSKAIAIRPRFARYAVVSGKATTAEAERDALAQCNRGGDDPWPCFLYASGMQVVLPSRRTEALR